MAKDLDLIEKKINHTYFLRVKEMKKVKKEKLWSELRWEKWHTECQQRRGLALKLARAAIETKNKTLDDLLKDLDTLGEK